MEISSHRVPLNVNVPVTLRDQLREAVPPRQRSKFITEAIESALRNNDRQKAKEEALAALKNAPAYDTNGQDSVEVLRRLRQEHTQRIVDRHNPLTS